MSRSALATTRRCVRVADGHELVLAVDMMVESRHFLADTDPESLGHKMLAVNLSDIAAMGARPRWALLAGALPDSDASWLEAFSRGLFALADEHGVDADRRRHDARPAQPLPDDRRRGARSARRSVASGAVPGDDVWVSGTLGDAMLALAALQRRTTLPAHEFAAARRRLERPEPRVALGQALRGVASAMLDVSDGLTGDLAHILEASGVGAIVDVARDAAVGGAGCEARRSASATLRCAACSPAATTTSSVSRRRRRCASASARWRPPTVAAGARSARSMPREAGFVVRDERGEPLPALPRAFDHFA